MFTAPDLLSTRMSLALVLLFLTVPILAIGFGALGRRPRDGEEKAFQNWAWGLLLTPVAGMIGAAIVMLPSERVMPHPDSPIELIFAIYAIGLLMGSCFAAPVTLVMLPALRQSMPRFRLDRFIALFVPCLLVGFLWPAFLMTTGAHSSIYPVSVFDGRVGVGVAAAAGLICFLLRRNRPGIRLASIIFVAFPCVLIAFTWPMALVGHGAHFHSAYLGTGYGQLGALVTLIITPLYLYLTHARSGETSPTPARQ